MMGGLLLHGSPAVVELAAILAVRVRRVNAEEESATDLHRWTLISAGLY